LFLTAVMHAAPCGIHGNADSRSQEYVLNPFKNRSQAPRTVNPLITLERLAQGARYENTEAAAIIGYVALVNLALRKPAIAMQKMQRTRIRTSRS
jgi:hypothetical protein